MEAEGILFVVKYLRMVNNYLDIMTSSFPGKKTEQSALKIPTKLLRFGPGLSPSNRVGIFKPPYFFQYVQQDAQRRHCMLGGPQEYHW